MPKPTTAESLYSNANTYGLVHPQQYRYSFSGADAKLLVYFPQKPELMTYLESAHTLSISVHESKSQVRSLGYRGAKGLTRSIRTIAGSLILTVVNDHPLRPLLDQFILMAKDKEIDVNSLLGWSADMDEIGIGSYKDIYTFENRLCSLLPPFNAMIEFVSEISPVTLDATSNNSQRKLFPGAGLLIQGIEFIDEGFVVSVNDLVTEITLSYVARDFKPISAQILHDGGSALTRTDIGSRSYELYMKCFPPGPKGAEWAPVDPVSEDE